MYVVYMHKTPSNKVYIGITSQKPEKRWHEGLNYNEYFTNAIKKYGWDNIEHIILAENLSKEDACKLEQDLIAKYKSTDTRYGYNITMGGNVGCLGYKHTEGAKHQMSLDRQGKKLIRRKKNYKPWNFGTHLTDQQKENLRQHRLGTTQSDETKQKISNSLKGRTYTDEYKNKVSVRQTGCNNSFYGKSHSEETRKRISANTSNRIWINDGHRCKRVKPEELQLFLAFRYTLQSGIINKATISFETEEEKMLRKLKIKKVIYNEPATIVYWEDGDRTVVKAQNGEPFDKEKGLAMAMCKRMAGDKGNYNDVFRKWCD